jgi:hypothetical protein
VLAPDAGVPFVFVRPPLFFFCFCFLELDVADLVCTGTMFFLPLNEKTEHLVLFVKKKLDCGVYVCPYYCYFFIKNEPAHRSLYVSMPETGGY